MEPPPAAPASKGQSPAGPLGGKQKKDRSIDSKPIRAQPVNGRCGLSSQRRVGFGFFLFSFLVGGRAGAAAEQPGHPSPPSLAAKDQ